MFNTLRPRQNGRHFPDDTLKRNFMNENARISINISLKFVPKGLINNIPALVQIMAWRRPGDKPLTEPMMVNLLTHICVTRSQWVKRAIWEVDARQFYGYLHYTYNIREAKQSHRCDYHNSWQNGSYKLCMAQSLIYHSFLFKYYQSY